MEAVTSTLNSFTLSDDVFIGPRCFDGENVTFIESEETGSSCMIDSSCSEIVEGTDSSDGIRGVWFYLTSSTDSSGASLSTTMPRSTTATSSYSSESCTETTASSLSIIEISSSVEDDETARGPACTHQNQEIITLSDTSSIESDLVCDGSGEPFSADGNVDEPNLTWSDEKCNEAESGEELQEPKVDFISKVAKSGVEESMRGVNFILNLTHWSTVVVFYMVIYQFCKSGRFL